MDETSGSCCWSSSNTTSESGGVLSIADSFLETKPKVVKVVLLGSVGVGKTTLINQLSQSDDILTPSCVFDKLTASLSVTLGGVRCNIWDTAGHEKYRKSITPSYLRGASICLLVYSLDDEKSLDDIHIWFDLVEEYAPGAKTLVVATKNDLARLNIKEGGILPDVVTAINRPDSIVDLGRSIGDLASKLSGYYTL